ncbi:nuclear transport factor 2 family protein [soil metagenome]
MTNPTELVNRYFQLAPRPDADAYFAQFAEDAVAEDEGHEYHGIDEIRSWRKAVPLVTYTVGDVVTRDDEHVAHAEIAGDFPGSPVTLAFHFTFTGDGHIQTLVIRS